MTPGTPSKDEPFRRNRRSSGDMRLSGDVGPGGNVLLGSRQIFINSPANFASEPDVTKTRVLEQLWTDYKTVRNTVEEPHEHTCQWFPKRQEYKDWREKPTALLYVVGDPGVGKSVLARFLLERLDESTDSKDKTIYFFCSQRKKGRGHTTAITIVKSLIYQCVDAVQSLFQSCVKPKYERLGDKLYDSWADLEELFKQLIISGDWYCVIDALDDCEEVETDYMLKLVEKIFGLDTGESRRSTANRIRLLVTSRPSERIRERLHRLASITSISFTDKNGKARNDADMERYVEDWQHLLPISYRSDNWRRELIEKAEGNFKWVACKIKELIESGNHSPNSIPKEIGDIFEQLISAMRPEQRYLLKWVAYAYRPLSLRELGYAPIIGEKGELRFNYSYSLDEETIRHRIRLCGGILRIREEEGKQVVTLLHSSMKNFLSEKQILGSISTIHQQLADACLGYFHSCVDPKRGPITWINESGHREERFKKSDCRESYEELLREYPFLEYAAYSWLWHLQKVHMPSRQVWKLSQQWLQSGESPQLIFQVHQFARKLQFVPGQSCLHLLVHYNHCDHSLAELMRECLNCLETNPNAIDHHHRTALWWAVEKDYRELVTLLLENDSVNPYLQDLEGLTPFSLAAKKGRLDILQILLNHREALLYNSTDAEGRNALSWAAGNGHADIVKVLLRINTFIDSIDTKDNKAKQTPLLWATRKGHEAVVHLLLRHSADPRVKDSQFQRNALSWAAGNGDKHKGIVKRLLDQGGSDLMAADIEQKTAFHRAVQAGSSEVASLILHEIYAKSDSRWQEYSTLLLMQTVTEGNVLAMEILLNFERVDHDSRDSHGRSALSRGAERGYVKIVELLLSKQADVNSADVDGRTPMSWACSEGRLEVVKILLSVDSIKVNAVDKAGKTPLKWAHSQNREDIVELLRVRQDVVLEDCV